MSFVRCPEQIFIQARKSTADPWRLIGLVVACGHLVCLYVYSSYGGSHDHVIE